MLRFKQFLEVDNCLKESRQILYNNGSKYGQVVFMAGGAGSGKGFSLRKFMENDKFKTFDVDELKSAFIKMAEVQRKGGKYTDKKSGEEKKAGFVPKGDFKDFDKADLKNPEDVTRIHHALNDKGSSEKRKDSLFKSIEGSTPEKLPNLIFDITLRHMKHVEKAIPILKKLGYDTSNIHLTWILADYSVAVEQNKQRDRQVADDVMLDSHEGAASNMFDILQGSLPKDIDGEVRVLLSGKNNSEAIEVVDKKTGKPISGKDGKPVTMTGIPTIKVKNSGKPMMNSNEVTNKLYGWIKKSIPLTSKTKHIHSEIKSKLDGVAKERPCSTPEKKAKDGSKCGGRAQK